MMDDKTTVISSQQHESVELDVAVWFFGRGRVSLRIERLSDTTCEVVMSEWMTEGLMSKVPEPAIDFLLTHRNVESLKRLAAIAEGRGAATGTSREDA
jgi:hypothetical protein